MEEIKQNDTTTKASNEAKDIKNNEEATKETTTTPSPNDIIINELKKQLEDIKKKNDEALAKNTLLNSQVEELQRENKIKLIAKKYKELGGKDEAFDDFIAISQDLLKSDIKDIESKTHQALLKKTYFVKSEMLNNRPSKSSLLEKIKLPTK